MNNSIFPTANSVSPDPTQVHYGLTTVDNETNETEKLVSELECKLVPVLRVPIPTGATAEKAAEELVPVAGSLRSISRKVSRTNASLADILHRLEV